MRSLLFLLMLSLTLSALGRERTALVLGGGGARGSAHVGVLKALEQMRVPVDCVVGTSMGSIVGGLYAAGLSPARIEKELTRADWRSLFSNDSARRSMPVNRKNDELSYLVDLELGVAADGIHAPLGLLSGQRLETLLRRVLWNTFDARSFDGLPLPFRAVATDLRTGERVLLANGDLVTAIRASMSVPLVFAPVVYQGHVLVDGGLVENVPIAAGRELCGERLIVVDVSELPIPEHQLSSALQVSAQTVRLLINRETARMLATLDRERDLLIQPDLANLRSGDFDRVEEGIAAGEAKAQSLQAALSLFAISEPEYELWRKRQRRQLPADATIEFVDVIGHRSRTSQFVANQLSELKGSKLGSKNIERAINRTLGDGDYSRVSYRVVKQQDRYGLEVTPEDKPWGPTLLRFGFALEDDFEGRTGYQLGAEARRVGLNDYGAEARLRVDFGEVAGISARFLQPLGATSEYFIDNQLGYSARNILFGANNTPSGEYRLESSTLLLGFGYEPNERLQLRLGFESIDDNASIRLGDRNGLPDLDGDSARIAFGATYDDLNDAAFPRVGERWVLNLKNDLVSLGADGNNLTGSLGFDWVRSLGRHSVALGGRFFATDGSAQNYRQQALLGGFGRLSGFRRDALAGDRAGLLRAIYYRRLTDGARLGSAPLYLGGSLEVGNAWDREQRFGGGEPVLAASMFLGLDTPFGPVFLAYGRNDLQQDQLYLNVGSLFAD